MSSRAERFRQKAADCELAAAKAKNPEGKTLFLDLARQWRELAHQAERMDSEKHKDE